MKRLLFSVLTLLMACGLALADGVKVSGNVFFKPGTYTNFDPGYSDSIWLVSESTTLRAYIVRAWNSQKYNYDFNYEFPSVEAGTYRMSYNTYAYAGDGYASVSYDTTFTVGTEEIQLNFVAKDDPTQVAVTIVPKYLHPQYSYWVEGLAGVSITCKKGDDEEVKMTTESSSSVRFYCDTTGLYTFTLHKEGYKDTTFQIKALEKVNSYGVSVGKEISVPMQEDLGEQVILKGEVSIQGTTGQDTIQGLYLAVSWNKKTWVTPITNGRQYEFEEPIPAGDVVYRLTTSPSVSYYGIQPARNYRFVGSDNTNPDTLAFTVPAPTKVDDTVTNNLTITRVGVNVTGRFMDTVSNPGNPQGIVAGWVKIYNDTYRDSAQTNSGVFELTGVQSGTYTLAFSKSGYESVTEQITIDITTVAFDSTVQLGDFYTDPAQSEYTFNGQIYYSDPKTYSYIYPAGVKVVMINGAGERIDSTITKEQGNWEIKVMCYYGTRFTFEASAPEINTATAVGTAYNESNYVYISCTAKTPDLLGMENAKARQIADSLKVELTWEWPEELLTGLKDNTYDIWRIYISRIDQAAGTGAQDIVFLMPENNDLPTHYVDSGQNENYPLEYDKTYTYFFKIQYNKPSGTKEVTDFQNLTVTLSDVIKVDSFNLTLEVNDLRMGAVVGGGRYPEGSEITIKATPRPGYVFEAWKAGETQIATTPEHTLVLSCDSLLTAVFAPEPVVVPDSFNLVLNVDAKMGQVEGAGRFEKGTEVTIKATANEGYEFVAWTSGNDTIAKTAEYKLVLTCDSTLTAVFVEEQGTSNEDREQAAWSVSVENQTIVLHSATASQYDVYNMAGVLVKHAKTNANEYRVEVSNSGLYIIRRISATGYSVKKVVVR